METRSDYTRAEDVRADLKTMEDEREQLRRKIDRCRRKVGSLPELQRYLELAARYRTEQEENQKLQLQQQEQGNAVSCKNP